MGSCLIEFIWVGTTQTVAFLTDGQVVRVLLHDMSTVCLRGVVMMGLIDMVVIIIWVNYRLRRGLKWHCGDLRLTVFIRG